MESCQILETFRIFQNSYPSTIPLHSALLLFNFNAFVLFCVFIFLCISGRDCGGTDVSESEAEEDPETVTVTPKMGGKISRGIEEVGIKLVELGPRITMQVYFLPIFLYQMISMVLLFLCIFHPAIKN